MRASVVEEHLQVHDGVASQRALREGLDDALLHRGYVLLGNVTANHPVGKLKAASSGQRLQLDKHVAVLAMASGLLLVLVLGLGAHRDGLPIRYLGRSRQEIHAKLPLRLFHCHVHVGIPHRFQKGLTGGHFSADVKGGVLLHQPGEGTGHLIQICLALGIYGQRADGIGEADGLQHQGRFPL